MEWKKVSIFLAWAVFTFCSHYSAKQFLSSSEHLTENVILLTSLQMAAGSVLFLKLTISGGVGVRIKFSSHLRPQTITVQVSIRKVNILFQGSRTKQQSPVPWCLSSSRESIKIFIISRTLSYIKYPPGS